jgi:hypothetical protein
MLARRDKVGFEPPQTTWLSSKPFRARFIEGVLLDPKASGSRPLLRCDRTRSPRRDMARRRSALAGH